MQRQRAHELVEGLLIRLTDNPRWPLTLVDEVRVFGSFARGALQPHDVDIAVEFTADQDMREDLAAEMFAGGRPYTLLRRELSGGTRGMQLQFQELHALHADGIETLLLWRRGETLRTARDRLAAITPDPHAGRAERDRMLPAFEGVDRYVPRPVRHLLADWSGAGAVSVARVDLPDATVRDAQIRRAVERRWNPTSPLRRAAANALAYLDQHGARLHAVHLHGRDLDEADTPYFIGFQWRHAELMHQCLTHFGGTTWLEVPRPATVQPLFGLLITVTSRELLTDRPARA